MAKKHVKREPQKAEGHKEERYVLRACIGQDQREYIEGVREWLHDSLAKKGKMVGGPI